MSEEGGNLGPGTSALIGSLPHQSIDDAIRAQRVAGIDLLTLPELITTDPAELMLPRALRALPEVSFDALGAITVDPQLVGHDLPSSNSWLSQNERAFLTHPLTQQAGAIKVQTVGPVTAAQALIHAGVPPEDALIRARDATAARVQALTVAAEHYCPDATRLIMLDEPSLATSACDPAQVEIHADLISGVLHRASKSSLTGIHTCGNLGLDVAFAAGCDVLTVLPTPDVFERLGSIIRHTEAGGMLAWGVVPTSGPLAVQMDLAWDGLVRLWCELANRGADPLLLRTQALITPECGLGRHRTDAAEQLLTFVGEIQGRVRDQVVATRLSLGA